MHIPSTRSRSPLARRVSSALAVVVVLLAAAALTHRVALVSTYGVSMEPHYTQGDLVVVARSQSYARGDIVAYRLPAHRSVVLHRIVGGDDDGFVVQGDNNQEVDAAHPRADQLLGRAVLHVPRGGTAFHHLTSAPVLAGLALSLLSAGGTAVRAQRHRRTHRMSRTPTHVARRPGPHRSAWAHLPPSLQRLSVLAGLSALSGLAVGALAWSTPLPTTGPSAQEHARSMRFGYEAVVGRTPAYDGTVVHAPDVLFRSLVSAAVVRLDYAGAPGTMDVRGEMSTASGWRTGFALRRGVVLSDRAATTDVRLDLDALWTRAQRGTAAAGVPLSDVTVRVITDVRSAGTDFSPELRLSLNTTALSVPDRAALIVRDAALPPPVAARGGRVVVAGHSFDARSLRTASTALLGLGVLLGGVAARLARRQAPLSEAALIARRHAGVLLEVHPLPSAPGRPMVDVPDVASLVRLAERYGLLVLHWSRSGVQTYVVQDDGTTYRYRTGEPPVCPTDQVCAPAAAHPSRAS